MKRFLIKTILSVLIVCIAIVVLCFVLQSKSNNDEDIYTQSSIYVWGDSQMYQGLDIKTLSENTSKKVFSSAEHGAGVYDFLVTVARIPEESTCIIALPECCLYRRLNSDYNRSGFDIKSILIMLESGYPIQGCIHIVRNNFLTHFNFSSTHESYKYAPKIVYSEPLSGFYDMFNNGKNYTNCKLNAYKRGISCLIDKRCRIILLQFPFSEEVESFAVGSINRRETEMLKEELINKYSFKSDTIYISSDSLIMHDLSHMTDVGVYYLQKCIGRYVYKLVS